MVLRAHHLVAWSSQRDKILAFALLFLPVATALAAQADPPEPGGMSEKCLTAQSFLHEKLGIWQKRIKLEEWNISVKTVRLAELKPKTLGNIHWDSETHRANINVLSPVDYKLPFPDALKDMEFTIVHELLHLQLSSLPRNEASRSAEEKAVNALTEALLNLDRRP
jgi:hypothetical protein